MAVNTKKLSSPKAKRPSRERKGASVVPVSGDTALTRTPLKKLKKVSVARRALEPVRVDAPAVLVSVDISAGPAKVSRYAGLFFIFVGVLFATHSLSGIYVELVELSTLDHHVLAPHAQRAQVISGLAQPLQTTIATPIDEPPQAVSTSTGATSPVATTTPALVTNLEPAPTQNTLDKTLMQPKVELVTRGGTPHEGVEELAIRVANANTVELLLIPRETLTERYLGKAKRVSNDYWQFAFDTRNTPNGEYGLFVRVTNSYGTYQNLATYFRIKNEVTALPRNTATTTTPETAAIQAEIANVAIEFKATEPRTDLTTTVVPMIAKTTPPPVIPPPSSIEPTPSTALAPTAVSSSTRTTTTTPPIEKVSLPEPLEERAVRFVESIDSDLDGILELYGVAIRGNDSGAVSQMEQRLTDFEAEISKRVESELIGEGMVATTDEATVIRERIIGLVREERTRRHKEERMILDRVGDKIQRDSDRDGISDYDESHLYKTDPFVADSDADGFLDGAEVLSGYDPASDVREAMVAFEDPRTNGIERGDILGVSRLDVVREDGASTTEIVTKSILLSGIALPNSFVTLYVYSTPVVVTVKTNDDGSWSYVFDKELEDGQHEIFVGVTDNAGKLVAKSKPFAFVKTAEAYTIGRVQGEPLPSAAPAPRLMSENALILTTSLVVILVGLVLVLIGAYLARRTQPALSVVQGAI